MNEEVELYLEDGTSKMDKVVAYIKDELSKMRAGKASVQMVDGLTVGYYGSQVPFSQVANLGTTDSRTLVIQPWDKKMIEKIEKVIFAANIGITPINNGEVIRLCVPPLTEERRKALVKQVKAKCEEAKVGIRNIRRDTIEEIKKLQKGGVSEDEAKDAEESVQKSTEQYYKKIEDICARKEEEIMTV